MSVSDIARKICDTSTIYPDRIFDIKGKNYTFVNPYSYLVVRKKAYLFDYIDGVFADGILVCIWVRLFRWKKIQRLSFDMTTIAKDLFERINKSGESIYFIGTTQEKLETAIPRIKDNYPKMNIVGIRNGYFKGTEDIENTIRNIVALNPAFTIVGMGCPRQEEFIANLKKEGYKGISFTCGGFLHQTAKDINYYPAWIDKYNLRAFYRLFHENGIWKRFIMALGVFPALFAYDLIKMRILLKRTDK